MSKASDMDRNERKRQYAAMFLDINKNTYISTIKSLLTCDQCLPRGRAVAKECNPALSAKFKMANDKER